MNDLIADREAELARIIQGATPQDIVTMMEKGQIKQPTEEEYQALLKDARNRETALGLE